MMWCDCCGFVLSSVWLLGFLGFAFCWLFGVVVAVVVVYCLVFLVARF